MRTIPRGSRTRGPPTACTPLPNEIRLRSVARRDSVLPRNRGRFSIMASLGQGVLTLIVAEQRGLERSCIRAVDAALWPPAPPGYADRVPSMALRVVRLTETETPDSGPDTFVVAVVCSLHLGAVRGAVRPRPTARPAGTRCRTAARRVCYRTTRHPASHVRQTR